jgi:protein-tyrosine-phosphatase
MVNQRIKEYIARSVAMYDDIPDERRAQLKKLAMYVQESAKDGDEARLTFICTHNSRRSHMSQIWAQTAAAYYGVSNVETYSGGTEATAFNPRAVAALERAGFEIEITSDDKSPIFQKNPVYRLKHHPDAPAMEAFSKVYSQAPNPHSDFCAVMTCSDADRNCPIVQGATMRVTIPYVDPGAYDDTDEEEAAYDERCRQISCEMLYLFSLVHVGG